MPNLIRNAIVYKAELPTASQLEAHLKERPYAPIGETELSRTTFVPVKATNELVARFEGGFAFALRHDEKILPMAIVRAKAAERIAAVESQFGGRLKKVERQAIIEQTMVDLAKTALVKTAIITAFYNTKDSLLIVPVGSKGLANLVVGVLIAVVGSVKTSTIHISDIKNGLTTRLNSHLDGAKSFEGFEVGTDVALKNEGQKVSYSLADLDTAQIGLQEAIAKGIKVERLAMSLGQAEFKLTSDFHFKAVKFDIEENDSDAAEEADTVFMWRQAAAVQVLLFTAVINQLCELLGYKPDEEADAA